MQRDVLRNTENDGDVAQKYSEGDTERLQSRRAVRFQGQKPCTWSELHRMRHGGIIMWHKEDRAKLKREVGGTSACIDTIL